MHAVHLLRPSCLVMTIRFVVFIGLVLDTILGKTKITRTDVGGLKMLVVFMWLVLDTILVKTKITRTDVGGFKRVRKIGMVSFNSCWERRSN